MDMKKFFTFCLVLIGIAAIYSYCGAAPAMVEKNLFSQDRKPPSPDSDASTSQPAKPGMPISNLQLDGVMIKGDDRKALIRMKSQAAAPDKKRGQVPYVTVRENQQIGDFRVVRIETKSVTLEKDGQSVTLSLFAEGKAVIPAAVQQSPVPGPGAGPPVGMPPGQQQQNVNQQRMQRPQPGEPMQAPNADIGVDQPQVVSNPGQEPDVAVTDQGILPEEEPQQ